MQVRIATGDRGGVYYAYGQGVAAAIQRELPGTQPSVLPTAASVDNLRMIADGRADVAFSLADAAALAAEGAEPFGSVQPVRALAQLYDNYTHLVVKDDGPIRSLVHLEGRVVSTGATGSGTELIARRLLDVGGVGADSGFLAKSLGVGESAAALRAGTIDAFFWSGGLPTLAIETLSRDFPIRLIDLAAMVVPMRTRHGDVYTSRNIPGTAYGLRNAVATIGVANYLVVNAAMDAGLAYELIAALFARRSDLIAAHPEARRLNRRAAVGTHPVALHPGAARYYRASKS